VARRVEDVRFGETSHRALTLVMTIGDGVEVDERRLVAADLTIMIMIALPLESGTFLGLRFGMDRRNRWFERLNIRHESRCIPHCGTGGAYEQSKQD
jgi:hypothetical protein